MYWRYLVYIFFMVIKFLLLLLRGEVYLMFYNVSKGKIYGLFNNYI